MRVLLRLLLPYWWRVVMAVALGTAVVASNMGLLAAAAYLVAAASVTQLMAVLILPMYAVRILSAMRGSARYAERLVSHRVTFDVLARLRVRLYDGFRRLGPAGMHGTRSGDSLSRVLADVDDLQNAYLSLAAPVAVAAGVTALAVVALLPFSAPLAGMALCSVAAAGVVLPLLVGLLARTTGSLVESRAHLHAQLVDTIQGSGDILSNGAGARFLDRIAADGRRMARAETRLALIHAGREGATELLTSLAMLSALALAVPLVTRHALAGVYLAVPALLLLAAFEAIRPLGGAAETVSGVRAAAKRVLSLAETPSATPRESPQLSTLKAPYSIELRGVTLAYPGSRRPAVRRVTLEVPAGSRVALVGPSGAGKTTLVHLLTRAWDPGAGQILIAGRDIREYSLRALRGALGVVSQDTYIFNDTIRANLLLARVDATERDLEEALAAVGLAAAVQSLPRGLDTWVGEHGRQLSGGERQRLAVARVLLQNAPLVLLDEITANLDPAAERNLLDTLYRVTEGRTLLNVTHRLIGLERMDEILVLDAGEIVERGTHAELCAGRGLYKRMVDVQDDMLAIESDLAGHAEVSL